MQCTDLGPQMLEYLAGTLPDDRLAEIRGHLTECAACRDEVDATADLWNATVRFARLKTKESLTALVDALNVVINQAHNNGWWFNKFIDAGWFDVAAKSPASPPVLIVTGSRFFGSAL